MEPALFEDLLRESPLLRSLLAEQFRACEQAGAILVEAISLQLDAQRLQQDLLALQQQAAFNLPCTARDRLLSAMRNRLPPPP